MHHLFGDSHIHWINNTNITKHLFSAGSAMGLNNPNSVSGYQNKFLEIYKNIPESEKIILKFGQVDTEFVYYIKLASNNNLSFVDFANDSITKYFNFIINNLDISRITIMSIYPPVVNDKDFPIALTDLHFMDNSFKNEINNKLKNINLPNIYERTKYNKIYNEILYNKCKEHSLKFIDMFSMLINDQLVTSYVNHNIRDHHLTNTSGVKLINEFINNIFIKDITK